MQDRTQQSRISCFIFDLIGYLEHEASHRLTFHASPHMPDCKTTSRFVVMVECLSRSLIRRAECMILIEGLVFQNIFHIVETQYRI